MNGNAWDFEAAGFNDEPTLRYRGVSTGTSFHPFGRRERRAACTRTLIVELFAE